MYITQLMLSVLMLVVSAVSEVDATDDKNPGKIPWGSGLSTFNIGHRPAGRKCHDFCAMMSEMCRNGGTCVTDEVTCAGKCVCRVGWTGKWCKEVEADGKNVADGNLEPDTARAPTGTRDADRPNHNVIDLNLEPLLGEINTSMSHASIPGVANITSGSSIITSIVSGDDNANSIIPKHEILSHRITALVAQNHTFSSIKTNDRETCLQACVRGDCYDNDGIYNCKQRVNISTMAAPRSCLPGFVCKHGVCDLAALRNKTYKCMCESNYVGTFCEVRCPYDCGEHGYCDYHVDDDRFTCVCQWQYTGVNCTQLRPVPPVEEAVVFHWYVVGICTGVVAAVLTVLAIVPYVMWRKRMVFILKIVHYFQQYEDDDGKEYDAFVSYKSTPRDEKFVLQHLYPRLETELRLRLCLHFRDFLPGEAIANNIVKAIESSRRTIMVLSPAYVKSEWCRMEYQKAQHEMLKLKHKIIPIVLEDISSVDNIDKNLQNIINSVTYLTWPGNDDPKKLERFWTKLELTLPKKSSSSGSNSSESRGIHSSVSSPAIVSTSVQDSPDLSSSVIQRESITPLDDVGADGNDGIRTATRAKKKDLIHFMGKLVRGKLFNRQDSTSSQAALVDDDAAASRSSCDSLSETIATDSTDSACSTPNVHHSYIDETGVYTDEGPTRLRKETDKEMRHGLCEKDHCDFSPCSNCTEMIILKTNSHEHINSGFVADDYDSRSLICKHCLHVLNSADNNRVKISPVKGSDALKITKLPLAINKCPNCMELLSNCNIELCGSVKMRKDVLNQTLVRQKRKGSLPWDFRRSAAREIDNSIESNITTQNDSIFIDVYENI